MIKFKDISGGLEDKEQFIAYVLYFAISVFTTFLTMIFGINVPRGIWIAVWGIPIGAIVPTFFSIIKKRNILLEIALGAAAGFPIYICYALATSNGGVFTFLDGYYFITAAIIYELGLAFFYMFFTATDSMEQREYDKLSVPLASAVMVCGIYAATALTTIGI